MDQMIKEGYVSNISQLYSVRKVIVSEGKAKGTAVIEVSTAGGLQADILPDTGLDIGQVRYKGVNITYITKNGPDNPAVIIPYEDEFAHTFPGGLLYTCGLRTTGPANRDGGEWMPTHGRYHSLQAENVSTDIKDGNIVIKGTFRETILFGYHLEVIRTITIPAYGSSITVSDEITNCTAKDEEIMQIYHCNFGYPFLSEKAKLILPKDRNTIPRTEFAKTGLGRECEFDKPVWGEDERVFFHLMDEKKAILENKDVGIRMNMTWSKDNLPVFAEWRCMAGEDYVLGLEPTNSYIHGRKEERENGTLPVLKAFDTIYNTVKFDFETI